MTKLSRISSLAKGVLLTSLLSLFAIGLKAQSVTINNSTGCAYDVTLVGAQLTTSALGDCDVICWASEVTVTAMPGTSTHTLTGCIGTVAIRAEVTQTGCVGCPAVTVEVPFCACGGGAATDTDSFVVPLSCCDPGATVTVGAVCSGGGMTVNIN